MIPDKDQDTIALQEAYANLYNQIVKPDRVFVATQYFRKKWMPLLGPSLAWVIIALRQHCYWSRETGEKRDWCLISQVELATEAGISVATLKRLLKQEYAEKFIIEVSHRYRYDPKKRKQVRKKSRYRIRMDDPLLPEDEALLREKLAQQLSGLNVDPETGQVDMLELLDKLSQSSLDDLQLTLSDRSSEEESPAEQVNESISELAEQISLFITGSRGPHGSVQLEDDQETNPFPTGVPVAADKMRDIALADDQVLVLWNGDYLSVPIIEVLKRDLRMSGGQLAGHVRTDCFFSVDHALGEGANEWLPEEEARIALMSRLEEELGGEYRQLGAFSLEEALRQYFSPELAEKFLAGKSDYEMQRIREWVIYTRQAKSLKNPAGFLRSRLESNDFPPDSEEIT